MDLSKLLAIAASLGTDFKALDTDVRAYLVANPPTNPEQQAQVDGIVASLTAIDTGVQALDSAAKAVPPAGGPTGGTA